MVNVWHPVGARAAFLYRIDAALSCLLCHFALTSLLAERIERRERDRGGAVARRSPHN